MATLPKTSVSFVLNGKVVVVEDASPNLSLNEWIRCQPGLTGTKRMCGEGGCGCCVVAATFMDPLTQKETTLAINSCLCRLYSIEGWNITTVEGIGSSSTGFHPIQQRIAEFNGSQCGYCTPGFVMSMYSLLQKNPKPTEQEIEDNFDGNICRCTGYRPILDAMKSFADKGCDIEDLGSKVCPKTGEVCSGRSAGTLCQGYRRVDSDPQWYRPTSLSELTALVTINSSSNIKLVAGDTGRGVFKAPEQVDIVVDIRAIDNLNTAESSSTALIVGAAVSLSNLIGLLQANKDKSSSFEHLANHLSKIANVPVRNVGTWPGNLMLTHNHDNFPSDVFTMLAGAGATITIASLSDASAERVTVSLDDFLAFDMSYKIILSLSIPFTSSNVVFRSFKVAPRAVNAHAYVNATFSMKLKSDKTTVEGKPTLIFGGIGIHVIQATATAAFLEEKNLVEKKTLEGAVERLKKELHPVSTLWNASNEYRQNLAINLFYKFYLAAIPDHISPLMKSAATPYVRPLSQGTQSYTPDSSEFPVTQPMTKLTAKYQASGEAQYTTDIPLLPDELAAAFVITTQANAKIVSVDTSAAEKIPGFVKILTASDIPEKGMNNFIPSYDAIIEEEVLAENFSQYAGQAVAIVIADTQESANKIAKSVTVNYESAGTPVVGIEEAIKSDSYHTNPGRRNLTVGDLNTLDSSEHTITGQIEMGSQYHFHMETQTALCIPLEDSYTVYSSTQWTSYVQTAVANVLGIPTSSVDVSVKRCGGAFGAKTSRPNWIAAACALGALATRRPVRMQLDLDTNMKMMGKRYPFLAKYKVGSTKEGLINAIDVTVYGDCGWTPNEHVFGLIFSHIDNAYSCPIWSITTQAVRTNTPTNLYTRSPGTVPAIFIMESMMDHLARSLKLDVEAVKRANLYQQGQVTPKGKPLKYCNITTIWDQLYQSADVAHRKELVTQYNKANRWRKQGMNMMPIKFRLSWPGCMPSTVLISIYANDGTVAVTHGGVEIGQGVNTKVAQIAAKMLGVSIDLVKVKSSNTITNPNGICTGGSATSDINCHGTIEACKILNSRIQPIREKNPELSWISLVQKCHEEYVDLSAKYYVPSDDSSEKFAYNIYGAAVSEVELDVLTGQSEILRVDILYDCGMSINPDIDIGQVEGAFVMGLGYWLTEKVVHDKATGKLLTHNTWEYKPPSCKDIPIDFRVELLKDAPNPIGVFGSKASGEPPLCLSCSVLFAIKRAIESAREDGGNTDFFPLNGPATVEDIQQACIIDPAAVFSL